MEKEEIIEEVKKEQEKNTSGSTDDMLKAIEELKANSVDKAAYEKVLEDNRKLLNSIVKGEPMKTDADAETEIDLNELRDSLFNQDNTNLEYARKALELRDELIKRGETDPFLPSGSQIIATDEDIAAADRVAEALKSCVDYADGDSDIFTTELQRIMVDNAPVRRRR